MSGFNLSAWAVRNPAIVLFLIIAILVSGTQAYFALGRAEDPIFTIKTMVITAVWPGASAEEVQQHVTDPIETRLRTLPFLDHVQSYSRQNVAVLQIALKDSTPGREVAGLWYQVRKKVGDIRPTLPADLRGPEFNDEYSDVYAAVFMLTAPEMQQSDMLPYAEKFRQQLLQVADVDKVEIIGERPRRVYVDLSYKRLATLGITVDNVFSSLRSQNNVVTSGFVETSTERINMDVSGGLDGLQSIANTPIIAGSRTVLLRDLANVTRGYEDPPGFLVRFNGVEALGLTVRMRQGADGLALGEELEAATQRFQDTLPLGIDLARAANQAEVIDEAVSEFLLKFVVAVSVVLVISLIALGFAAGIIVALSVPLTLAASFVIMQLAGMEFQRVTLGALILSLGLLVDDAIIAIEMILVKMEQGLDRMQAATFAWTSTAFPMLTGTLVTVAGFLPVGFAKSSAGEYAGGIFWVVMIALCVSWIVAVVFTPYLAVKLLPKRLDHTGRSGIAHDPYDTPFFHRFRSLVAFIIKLRWPVILATLGGLGVSGFLFTKVPQQFFPQSERNELLLDVKGAEGASFAQTLTEVKNVERMIADRSEVAFYTTYVGAGAPRFYFSLNPVLPNENFAQIVVQTKGKAEREQLRSDLIKTFAEEESATRKRVLRLEFGPPTGHVVQFRIAGPEKAKVLEIADKVLAIMRANPKTRDAELQWGEQMKSVHIEMEQDRLRQLGLSSTAVGLTLQTVFSGAPITQLRKDNRLVDVVLRAPFEERQSLENLQDVLITNNQGKRLPLSQVGKIEIRAAEPILWRRNGDVSLAVRTDIFDGIQGPDVTKELLPLVSAVAKELPPGYRIDAGGAHEESEKANAALFPIFPAMFLIMLTLIVLQVKSLSRMLLVFLTFPLGFMGASLSLYLAGMPFGFVALLGTLALGGIIVRNTLILADQIETDVASGMAMHDAIVETTVRRTRPVILTALAAVFAFLPLTLTSFWGPMAIVLIGGTLIGTLLTLLFLPALYAAWFRVKRVDKAIGTYSTSAQAI